MKKQSYYDTLDKKLENLLEKYNKTPRHKKLRGWLLLKRAEKIARKMTAIKNVYLKEYKE